MVPCTATVGRITSCQVSAPAAVVKPNRSGRPPAGSLATGSDATVVSPAAISSFSEKLSGQSLSIDSTFSWPAKELFRRLWTRTANSAGLPLAGSEFSVPWQDFDLAEPFKFALGNAGDHVGRAAVRLQIETGRRHRHAVSLVLAGQAVALHVHDDQGSLGIGNGERAVGPFGRLPPYDVADVAAGQRHGPAVEHEAGVVVRTELVQPRQVLRKGDAGEECWR